MARGLDSLAEGGTNYLVTTLSYSNSQRLILIPIPILATMVTVHGSCAPNVTEAKWLFYSVIGIRLPV